MDFATVCLVGKRPPRLLLAVRVLVPKATRALVSERLPFTQPTLGPHQEWKHTRPDRRARRLPIEPSGMVVLHQH